MIKLFSKNVASQRELFAEVSKIQQPRRGEWGALLNVIHVVLLKSCCALAFLLLQKIHDLGIVTPGRVVGFCSLSRA